MQSQRWPKVVCNYLLSLKSRFNGSYIKERELYFIDTETSSRVSRYINIIVVSVSYLNEIWSKSLECRLWFFRNRKQTSANFLHSLLIRSFKVLHLRILISELPISKFALHSENSANSNKNPTRLCLQIQKQCVFCQWYSLIHLLNGYWIDT